MEEMSAFFDARVDEYDEHMLSEVEGCREAYKAMAGLIPPKCARLLDLGCGTGLELDEIFVLFPDMCVTGIDLSAAMLEKLKQKYLDKNIDLICGNYFDEDLGEAEYDCAVSFQTMHHFTHEKKIALYRKIFTALKNGGLYIECDYMVESAAEEEFYYLENSRLRRELGIDESALYHYDTPCTVENQLSMLKTAGFAESNKVFRVGNTTILVARKD